MDSDSGIKWNQVQILDRSNWGDRMSHMKIWFPVNVHSQAHVCKG